MTDRHSVAEVMSVLKQMALFEAKVAELYSHCAATWKDNAQFWLGIWRDEMTHSRHIEHIMDLIRKKPERFQPGRVFDPRTIAQLVDDVSEKIESVKNGEITEDQVLFVAQGLEQGYLEESYSEIVETDDGEYRILMQEIYDDTLRHKDKVIQQIIDRAQHKGYIPQ